MAASDTLQPILALDSSTEYLSVALEYQNKITVIQKKVINQHSNFILPFINELLRRQNLSAAHLKTIVYAAGPGSFTGLRIGLAVLKGLALPYRIPLYAICGLDALAWRLSVRYPQDKVTAFLDARMNEVFYARYQLRPFTRLSDYTILKVTALNNDFYQDFPSLWTGNIFSGSEDKLPAPLIIRQIPKARTLISMVKTIPYPRYYADNAPLLYLRNKIALTEAERSHHDNRSL